MTAQYEDWADWAGDHPEQAEADLRRDRERADRKAEAEIAARLKLIPSAPSSCDTLGHEYDFGICLDCEGVDPNFEPTDEQITNEYLNRTFAA